METNSREKAQESQKESYPTENFELFVYFCGYNFLSNIQVKLSL